MMENDGGMMENAEEFLIFHKISTNEMELNKFFE